MKMLILFSLVIALLTSCVKATGSRNYKYTLNRGSHLYIEVFKAGILGRSTAQYLTDSVNFRIHIGTFDDDKEQIHCRINGNQIEVERRERAVGAKGQLDQLIVVSQTHYNIQELKKKHVFED